MMADHRMRRNHLKGRHGDRFNVKIAGVGYNLRRLLRWLENFARCLTAAWCALRSPNPKPAPS